MCIVVLFIMEKNCSCFKCFLIVIFKYRRYVFIMNIVINDYVVGEWSDVVKIL